MQGLRKRRTAEEAAPDEPSSSAVVETLKALDVYPKTLDDFKERTGSGAVISLVSCTAIFLPWCRRRGRRRDGHQLEPDLGVKERMRSAVAATAARS